MSTAAATPSPTRALSAVFKRELGGYFATPVAYVFIVVYLFLAGVFAFSIGQLFERGQADLQPLFGFLPWLFLFLIPAVSMRLWSEERRGGSIELLLTLPVPTWCAVLGKYLAAWVFTIVALALTFPAWITVAVLGDPDNGAILTGYFGAALMGGAFLAIGSCVSALTRSQVIAFVVSAVVCLLFVLAGYGPVTDFFSGWAPGWLVEAVGSFGFQQRFDSFAKGVLDARDLLFFVSLIAVAITANVMLVETAKGD